jgi:PAS domain S-box-containing protein
MDSIPGRGHADGSGGLRLMRDLLVSLPAAVAYVAGPAMVFEFANEDYCRAVGRHDLIGRPYREALPEAASQPAFEVLRQVLRTGEPQRRREEQVWVHRPGELEPIYVDSVYQPVRDDAGRVAGVLIFSIDVSGHVRDRRRLQELADGLRRSEERYRTLFETLPPGVIYYSSDGSVITANPAAQKVLGFDPSEMTAWAFPASARAVREDGSPMPPGEFPLVRALREGQVVPDVVMGLPHGRTGELRWLRVTAVPGARDERGRPQRAYTMFTDITDQRRAEAALRESNRLLERLREASIFSVVVGTGEGIQEANDAFLDLVGYTRADLESGRLTWEVITPPEWAQVDEESIGQLRRTGACPPYEMEYLHRDGHRVPALVGAVLIDRAPLRWAKFVVDLSARQRAEQERAELLAREQAARVEADAARERLALLLGAGELVTATGSRRELLDRFAQLVVPALSDFCVIFVPTAQGMLRAASVVHSDPARNVILERLRKIDMPPAGPLLPQLAFSEATTQLVTDIGAMTRAWSHPAQEVAYILVRIRPESAIAAPLLIGERPVGVAVLGRGDGRPRFTQTDMAVIGELARRVATGLANVETFAREHTVAETLQHALLPDAPPGIPGLDLAVRYLPATGGVHVGGDWYDAFPLGPSQAGLVIGDVAGHSIGSASIMGQIRSLLRAYALEHPSPADVLGYTNAAMAQLLPETVATVFYAVLDVSSGALTYANAGHPPALLAGAGGKAEYLDSAPGTMLGACDRTVYRPGLRQLLPGARLLLYTDGLIEEPYRDISEGLRALAHAMRKSPARTAEQTCESVQAALLGSRARADDVCFLAVHLQDQPRAGAGLAAFTACS